MRADDFLDPDRRVAGRLFAPGASFPRRLPLPIILSFLFPPPSNSHALRLFLLSPLSLNLSCPALRPQMGGIVAAVMGDELQANEAAFAGAVALQPPSLPLPLNSNPRTLHRKSQPLTGLASIVCYLGSLWAGALRVSVISWLHAGTPHVGYCMQLKQQLAGFITFAIVALLFLVTQELLITANEITDKQALW